MPPPTAAAFATVERARPAAPSMAAPAVAARPAQAAVVSGMARTEHVHGKPYVGMALVGVGFGLLIVQSLIVTVLPLFGMLNLATIGMTGLQVLVALGFVGLILALVGVLVGLRSVTSR